MQENGNEHESPLADEPGDVAGRNTATMTTTVSRNRQPDVLTPDERAARGKEARRRVPLESHSEYAPRPDRLDPVALLEEPGHDAGPRAGPDPVRADAGSPFAFYRGAALVMAADLATTPASGLRVQLCGDAHLSNFGVFATPGAAADLRHQRLRRDPARPVGVGRQAAGRQPRRRRPRQRVHPQGAAPGRAWRGASTYRNAMRGFAESTNLDVWYASIDVATWMQELGRHRSPRSSASAPRQDVAKARTRDNLQALSKLTELVDGHRRIISDPPLSWCRSRTLLPGAAGARPVRRAAGGVRRATGARCNPTGGAARAVPTWSDVARKVVGVGSVGTRCWIVLLLGRDEDDPLFLQVKEAQPSVLERLRRRQRASATRGSGWSRASGSCRPRATSSSAGTRSPGSTGSSGTSTSASCVTGRASADIERDGARPACEAYAGMCGWTLARAHARSGDRIAIASYLGRTDRFDERHGRVRRRPTPTRTSWTSTSSRRPSAAAGSRRVRGL